jgi:hypothetical protein
MLINPEIPSYLLTKGSGGGGGGFDFFVAESYFECNKYGKKLAFSFCVTLSGVE